MQKLFVNKHLTFKNFVPRRRKYSCFFCDMVVEFLLILKLLYILQKLIFVSLRNNHGEPNNPLIKAKPHGYLKQIWPEILENWKVVLMTTLQNKVRLRWIVLNWFKTYLSNKHQWISITRTLSSCFNWDCWVPQGPLPLGPILFNIYSSQLFDIKEKHQPLLHGFSSWGR